MAANVDSSKRSSLRLQDTRVTAENGPASSSPGSRGPAEPRTSGNAKSLSAEKRRAGTERQEGSLGKRRSEELLRRKQDPIKGTPQGKNETDQEPNNRAPSTGKKGPNAADRVPSMEPKSASHSPGGDDGRGLQPRRSQDSSSVNIADNPQRGTSSPATNASLNRGTRSSKAKSQEQPGASAAVRGLGEGAISSKDKARLAEPSSEKTQDSEGSVESSGHGSSLRPKRSRDGSSIYGENSSRGATAVTNASLKRETRSSTGRKQEGSEASMAIMGKDACSSKEIMENVDLVEPNSQKQENPDESNSHNRSLQSMRSREDSRFNVEDDHKGATPSTVTSTLSSRKTRASRTKEFEEPEVSSIAVRGGGNGLDLSQQKNENQAKANSQQGEGSEDPGGSSGPNRSSQPKGNLSSTNVNVEDSPRAAALSTGTNASFTRETRSSKAINFQEEKGSGDFGSSSQNRSLQRLRSLEVSSSNVHNSSRGPSSSTERCNLNSGGTRGKKDYEKAGLSTAANKRDSNTLLSKGERVMRPSNQSEETLDIAGGVGSPGKNLRPRRSHDGSGISGDNSEAIRGGDGTPSKERTGKMERIAQSGEVLGNISPRKNVTKKKNLEDPVDERHPSNLTMESNAGEAARDYKVHCCSKQLLQEVLETCTGICKEIVDSQHYLNEEQKQQHYKNMVWDFESAFQENISINGLSWHEAPDKSSEPDIKILEDQLDEAMVETSMKRKRYPRKILSHFVKALKTEREILNQYKPVVNPEKVMLDPALELRMTDLSATAATVCRHIHETKKALPVQLEKAEGFSEVLSLQPVLEESHIRKNIFNSRVVIEDISKSIPKILETTPTEVKPQDLATPVRSLQKRKISLPQRHLYPLQSKRKISLES